MWWENLEPLILRNLNFSQLLIAPAKTYEGIFKSKDMGLSRRNRHGLRHNRIQLQMLGNRSIFFSFLNFIQAKDDSIVIFLA
jgi:hypothetical protein